ncbi:MAG: zinc ribbon domain-containing protein [Clostridiales bacterium]|nr:zinc ribbon domain-containing protein [Clostridiales bacterium]
MDLLAESSSKAGAQPDKATEAPSQSPSPGIEVAKPVISDNSNKNNENQSLFLMAIIIGGILVVLALVLIIVLLTRNKKKSGQPQYDYHQAPQGYQQSPRTSGFCSQCGASLAPGTKFCAECGTKQS